MAYPMVNAVLATSKIVIPGHILKPVDFPLTKAVAGEVMWIMVCRYTERYSNMPPYLTVTFAALRAGLADPEDNVALEACRVILKAGAPYGTSVWSEGATRYKKKVTSTLLAAAKFFVNCPNLNWASEDAAVHVEYNRHFQALIELLDDDAAQTLLAIGYKLGLISPA